MTTPNDNAAPAQPVDENTIIAERRAKLGAIRAQGVAFPNDFRPSDKADALHAQYDALDNEALEATPVKVAVAGRMMLKRVMGKASFATIQDASGARADGRLQLGRIVDTHRVGTVALRHGDVVERRQLGAGVMLRIPIDAEMTFDREFHRQVAAVVDDDREDRRLFARRRPERLRGEVKRAVADDRNDRAIGTGDFRADGGR